MESLACPEISTQWVFLNTMKDVKRARSLSVVDTIDRKHLGKFCQWGRPGQVELAEVGTQREWRKMCGRRRQLIQIYWDITTGNWFKKSITIMQNIPILYIRCDNVSNVTELENTELSFYSVIPPKPLFYPRHHHVLTLDRMKRLCDAFWASYLVLLSWRISWMIPHQVTKIDHTIIFAFTWLSPF